MTPGEERTERLLQSGGGAAAIAAGALLALFVGADIARPFPMAANHGIAFPSPNLWLPESGSAAGHLLTLGMQAGVAVLMLVLNRLYKVVKSASLTFVSMFLVLQAMAPTVSTQLTSGPYVALVALVAMMWLMWAYNRPKRVNSVFLAFVTASAGAMFQSALMVVSGVLMVGLVQMRIFRLKPFLAALMGAGAPWWVLFCLGYESGSVHIDFTGELFRSLPRGELVQICICVGVSIGAGAVLTALNLMRIINANSRSRAYNGLLILTGMAVSLMIFVDYNNCAAYLTLLNAMTAFQIGHFMKIYEGKRFCYITVLSGLGAALILYSWGLWL